MASLTQKLSLFLAPHRITTLEGEGRKAFVHKRASLEYWILLVFVSATILSPRGLRGASLPFVSLVLLFGYVALSATLNRTIVEIVNGTLFVKHRPMPWPGNRAIPIENITSVYCERMEAKRRRHIHNIRILTTNGKALTILDSLYEESDAQSIVIQLKKWLYETKDLTNPKST